MRRRQAFFCLQQEVRSESSPALASAVLTDSRPFQGSMSASSSSRSRAFVAVTSAVGAAAGVTVYILWRRAAYNIEQPAVATGTGQADDEDPDPCAICLEPPHEAVRTQCRHVFCLGCFRSWAQRQTPPTAHVRCPLCTTAVLRLTPEFRSVDANAETMLRMRWLIAYNLEALLTVRLAWVTRAFRFGRSAAAASAVMLYVFTGHAWETVQMQMRNSFAPVPTATDCKLRASSRWLVSAHLLSVVQRIVAPPDERHEQMVELLETLRPLALFSMAFCRDARHARILLADATIPDAEVLNGPPVLPRPPPPRTPAAEAIASAASQLAPGVGDVAAFGSGVASGAGGGPAVLFASALQLSHAGALCRSAHLVGALLRLVRSLVVYAHARAPEAAQVHPLVIRALDVAIAGSELVAIGMHVRIELAGLHGLLTLFSWAENCGSRCFTKVRPHESGLWLRRYCEVLEEVTVGRGAPPQRHRRGVRWEEALRELYVPLRAMLAFYGERGLRRREFPRWAIEDIRRGHCILMGENAYATAAASEGRAV